MGFNVIHFFGGFFSDMVPTILSLSMIPFFIGRAWMGYVFSEQLFSTVSLVVLDWWSLFRFNENWTRRFKGNGMVKAISVWQFSTVTPFFLMSSSLSKNSFKGQDGNPGRTFFLQPKSATWSRWRRLDSTKHDSSNASTMSTYPGELAALLGLKHMPPLSDCFVKWILRRSRDSTSFPWHDLCIAIFTGVESTNISFPWRNPGRCWHLLSP